MPILVGGGQVPAGPKLEVVSFPDRACLERNSGTGGIANLLERRDIREANLFELMVDGLRDGLVSEVGDFLQSLQFTFCVVFGCLES